MSPDNSEKRSSAGRELNAEVVRRVLGIVWDARRCGVCGWLLAASIDEGGCIPGNCSQRPAPKHRADEPPPYSTDIGTAMTLMDAMKAKGYRWRVGTGTENPDHAFAAFWLPRGFNVQHDAEAETPALAICLAALAMLDDPEAAKSAVDAPTNPASSDQREPE